MARFIAVALMWVWIVAVFTIPHIQCAVKYPSRSKSMLEQNAAETFIRDAACPQFAEEYGLTCDHLAVKSVVSEWLHNGNGLETIVVTIEATLDDETDEPIAWETPCLDYPTCQ